MINFSNLMFIKSWRANLKMHTSDKDCRKDCRQLEKNVSLQKQVTMSVTCKPLDCQPSVIDYKCIFSVMCDGFNCAVTAKN